MGKIKNETPLCKKWRFIGKLKIVIACASAFLREG